MRFMSIPATVYMSELLFLTGIQGRKGGKVFLRLYMKEGVGALLSRFSQFYIDKYKFGPKSLNPPLSVRFLMNQNSYLPYCGVIII